MTDTSTAIYPFGVNSVFYKARGFKTGKIVTCFVWNPRMVRSDEITLTELEHGLYYFAHDFQQYGIHNAIFLEDGVPAKFHSFRIEYQALRLP